MKIFILFLLLVILPYLLVITTIYRMFLDYTGKNWGKSMEDTMISIGKSSYNGFPKNQFKNKEVWYIAKFQQFKLKNRFIVYKIQTIYIDVTVQRFFDV